MHSLNQQIAQKLSDNNIELANKILHLQYHIQPELKETYGPLEEEKCLRDIQYHLDYLKEAIHFTTPSIFTDYLDWVKTLFLNINLAIEGLIINLKCCTKIFQENFSEDEFQILNTYIKMGLDILNATDTKVVNFLDPLNPYFDLAQDYLESLLTEKRSRSSQIIIDAVENQVPIRDIYLKVFEPVQREIGRLWQLNKLSVAKEHYCTSVTQLVMAQLYPYILHHNQTGLACITTCVGRELHEIGPRMVADLLELAGWNTYHLGANTPRESIIDMIVEKQASLVGISATMTFHLPEVELLIQDIKAQCPGVKIMVGGYLFNQSPTLWQKVGADGYAPNAQDAVEVANRMVGLV